MFIDGATTFTIMTLSITTLSTATLSTKTVSTILNITVVSITFCLSFKTSVRIKPINAVCNSAECHYAEYRGTIETTRRHDTRHNDIHYYDTHHKNKWNVTLSIISLDTEYRYA